MRIILFLALLLYTNYSFANLIKPQPNIMPEEVINIQLNALKNNNTPYNNAGIEQTWEFAHPFNKISTGPLSNFTQMMYSPSYIIMLDHLEHKIFFIKNNNQRTFYFVELIDKSGNKFGFQWILEKVLIEGEYKNCWMTTAVSQPILLSKSI